MPADEVLRDDTVRILGPHELVEGVAVHVFRFRTSTPLQVMHNASGGGEPSHAQWARCVRATVDVGIEMLELVSGWSQYSCRDTEY